MTRGPSIESMVKYLKMDRKYAAELKKLMMWEPYTRKIYGLAFHNNIDAVMDKANQVMGAHGVESVQDEAIWVDKYWQNTGLLYVNKGDTYHTTLCYDTEKDYFFIGSWGDWAERLIPLWEKRGEL